jgi:glycosyltransferase involved in cell wall biosynthesis
MAPPTIAVDLRPLVRAATGIGVVTREQLCLLAPRGEHRFLGLSHAPVAEPAVLTAAGLALEVQPTFRGVVWQQLRLPRRLAQGDVDLFWSPHMILPLRLPVPGVTTVHDLTTVLYPEAHSLKVKLSVLPFLRRTLDNARRIVAVSTATADDLRRHFPESRDRLRVVPNGVDRRFAPADADAIAATRARLGLTEGYLLYAGTLEPRKNLGQLLDAWEHLKAQDSTVPPLVFVGGYGWHSRGLLRRLARLAPHGVRHLGRVSDEELLAIVQAARVFVYPSLYEGFGLPALEALACGIPTIASNVSSLPEVVGKAGLLVEPGEVMPLASAIRRLLDDPGLAAELAARGPVQAARFGWPRSADLLAEVFREALA